MASTGVYWRDWATTTPTSCKRTGTIEFTLPEDMTQRTVNGQEGLWLRVRLAQGGYGRKRTVQWQTGIDQINGDRPLNEFTYH